MAKKVEQLPAQTAPAGTGLVVVSESGVSKKSTIDQMQAALKADLEAQIDAKATPNPLITPGTKTKITYDEHGFVTGGTNATTADINDTINRRYLTDAQLVQVVGLATLYDEFGNLVIPTTGAGIKMKDDLGINHVVNVDRDGQVINMSGFITTKSGKFFLRGKEYNGIGVNYYPLAWSDKASVLRLLDYAVKVGINEVRFWAFNQLTPSDSAGNFSFLDYPLVAPNMFIGVAAYDFEADFAGWTPHAEFTRVSDGNAHTGSYAIKQVSAGGYNGMSTAAFTVIAGANHTLTLWYKKISQSGYGPLLIVNKGSDGTQLLDGGLMEQDGDPLFNNGYVRKQVYFNSGSETSVTIRILNFGGTCTYYYDDFFLNPTGTPIVSHRESQYVLMDFIADEARKRGIKLSPSFADNTSSYNTKQMYVTWANAIYGAGITNSFPWIGFFNNTFAKQLFKDELAYFWNRENTINHVVYKDDPTFKVSELGNELRADRSDPSGVNSAASANIALISGPGGWADEMSTYLKVTLGIKQLVTYGSMSHAWEYKDGDSVFNGSFYGVDYRLMAALPHIDYLDFHWYPTQDALQPFLYPLGENDIVSYGQKLNAAPIPVRSSGTNVNSKVTPLNAAAIIGDVFLVHLVFSGTPGSTPVVTDSAGNTYSLVSNTSTTYHFQSTHSIAGAVSITATWTTLRNVTVYVDENSGRENANNGRSRVGLEAQLLDFINAGLAYDKPSTISEHGYSRDINTRLNVHYPLQPRVNAFDALFDFWYGHGGGQINLWSAAIVGGGSYSINLGERDGEAITDNSDDTNINNLLIDWNEKFHHHEAKSAGDDDTRYTDSELIPKAFDGDYQGTLQLGTAGEALSFGHLVYLDEFTGYWKKAGALLTTSRDRRLAMCVLAASGSGKSIKVLTFGNIRADSLFPTLGIGKPVFMSETAGLISTSKPTTTGAYHRVIGYADSADQLYFQPSGVFGVVS